MSNKPWALMRNEEKIDDLSSQIEDIKGGYIKKLNERIADQNGEIKYLKAQLKNLQENVAEIRTQAGLPIWPSSRRLS